MPRAFTLALAIAVAACGSRSMSSTQPIQPTPAPAPAPITQAVPTGTHTVSGIVVERGGGPRAGVPIATVLIDQRDGPSAVTDEAGRFTLTGLPFPQNVILASKPGYEPNHLYDGPTARDSQVTIGLQRQIAIAAGQNVDTTLFVDDLVFITTVTDWLDEGGELCGPPCKFIRVSVPRAGRLQVRAEWGDPSVTLGVYAREHHECGWSFVCHDATATGATGTSAVTVTRSVPGGTVAVFIGVPNLMGNWWAEPKLTRPLNVQVWTTLLSN